MKFIKTIVAGTAALATGGILFAGQAAANPSSPAPTPGATTTAIDSAPRAAKGAGFGWFYGVLTDVQRQCLADARIQRPEGKLTDAQRAELSTQVQAALTGCGVKVPARLAERPRLGFGWASLSSEQQQCLAAIKLTRPIGRLTDTERTAVKQSVKDAVTACRK